MSWAQVSLPFILFVHNENSKAAQTIFAYSVVSILRANLDHVLGTSQKSTKKRSDSFEHLLSNTPGNSANTD